MPQKRGKLIVIEGADKSGKQTQTKLLVDRLRNENVPCESMSFPRYDTPTGKIVEGPYLGKTCKSWFEDPDKVDSKIASLYYGGDRRYSRNEISQIRDSGTHLILDRYYQSNMAHQGGKIRDSKKRLKLFKELEGLELGFLELPKEDAVIFLYMPTKVAIELRKRKNEKPDGHESNIGHLYRAESTYLQLADFYNWIKINCAPDGTVNSLRTPKDIHKEVYKHIRKIMKIKKPKTL